MFIRRTITRSRKDGRQYYSYRLVENFRTENGVRQRTLLNLRSNFSLPREKWPDLAKRIEELISGQMSFFSPSEEIEELAKKYASQIIASQASSPDSTKTSWEEVDTNSIELSNPRSVGGEHVMLEAVKALKLDEFLRKRGFNTPSIMAISGNLIGRAVHPGSERSTHKWLQNISALGEILEFDYSTLSLDRMYRSQYALLSEKTRLEKHLYQQEKNLFSLNETITLYDLTNTYFEGQCKGNKNASFGRSKEKRTDLAPCDTGSGWQRFSTTQPGF